jgi:hypothetical protein
MALGSEKPLNLGLTYALIGYTLALAFLKQAQAYIQVMTFIHSCFGLVDIMAYILYAL